MNEYRALMRAIQAAPEDDLPRLVFADWLDERGDPRGEFIRLQVYRAQYENPKLSKEERDRCLGEVFYYLKEHKLEMPASAGDVTQKMILKGEYSDVQATAIIFGGCARENQLLEAHGEKWRFWPNRMYDRQDAPFERGFMATEIKPPQLQWLGLQDNQLTSLSGMPELPQLRGLYLNNNQLTSLSGMPQLPQLQELNLHNNQLTSLSGMPELPGLRWLNLKRNPLKTEEIEKLARGDYGCAHLRQVWMDEKYVDAFVDAWMASGGLPNLQHLNGQAVVHHVVPSVPPDAPGGESTQELTEPPATASPNDNTHQFTAFPEVKVESVQRSEPPSRKPGNAMLA